MQKQNPSIIVLKTAIEAIKKNRLQMRKWQKTFDEMFNGHFVPTYSETLEIALIDIVREVYNDKNDMISWWIYELDFGAECDENTIRDENNNSIPCKTIDDLYNYYVQFTLIKS